MGRYIFKKFIFMIIAIWFIVTVTFLLTHSIIEDPIIKGRKLPADIKVNVDEEYGLDKPIITQYGMYLNKLIKGDLGLSLAYKTKRINSILGEGIKVSFNLGILSIAIGVILGGFLGVIQGLNNKGLLNKMLIIFSFIIIAIPGFVFAFVLQYYFGIKFKWLPAAGLNGYRYMILPVTSLALGFIAVFMREVKTAISNALDSDYVLTAKAMGLSKKSIIINHLIKNAFLSMINLIVPTIAASIIGVIIIENIFVIPGIGNSLSQGFSQFDYTMVLATTLILSIIVIIAFFIRDILCWVFNPEVRIGK